MGYNSGYGQFGKDAHCSPDWVGTNDEWKEPVKDCGYEIAETVHTMNQTKKAFSLVIKREPRKQENLFEVGIIAYNLFIGFKRLSCPELWLKHIPMHRDDNSLEADTSSRQDSETFRKHPDASGLSADFKKLELFKGIRKSIEELFSYKL